MCWLATVSDPPRSPVPPHALLLDRLDRRPEAEGERAWTFWAVPSQPRHVPTQDRAASLDSLNDTRPAALSWALRPRAPAGTSRPCQTQNGRLGPSGSESEVRSLEGLRGISSWQRGLRRDAKNHPGPTVNPTPHDRTFQSFPSRSGELSLERASNTCPGPI